MDVRNSTCSANESSWHEASRSTPGVDHDHEMCVRAPSEGCGLHEGVEVTVTDDVHHRSEKHVGGLVGSGFGVRIGEGIEKQPRTRDVVVETQDRKERRWHRVGDDTAFLKRGQDLWPEDLGDSVDRCEPTVEFDAVGVEYFSPDGVDDEFLHLRNRTMPSSPRRATNRMGHSRSGSSSFTQSEGTISSYVRRGGR
jgi:hypothetical protein